MINEKLKQIEGVVKDIQLYLSKVDRESLDLDTNINDLTKLYVKLGNFINELIRFKKERGTNENHSKTANT